jgi:hypothetical protein
VSKDYLNNEKNREGIDANASIADFYRRQSQQNTPNA